MVDAHEGRELNPLLTVLLICTWFVATGCASVGVTPVRLVQPKPETCELEIYVSEAEVYRPFEVACLIDSRTGSTGFHTRTAAAAIDIARPAACECGADALLVGNTNTSGMTSGSWGEGTAIIRAIRYER